MRSHRYIILFMFLFSLLQAENMNPGNTDYQAAYKADEIVIKFKRSHNKNNQAMAGLMSAYNLSGQKAVFAGAQNRELARRFNLDNVYKMKINDGRDPLDLAREIAKRSDVVYAEPVYLSKVHAVTPNDSLYASQYHLPQVAAPDAWEAYGYGNSSVVIGVVDTGVDWDHEDLADIIWENSDEIPDNGIDDDNNGYVDDIRGWDFVTGVSGSGDSDADPGEDGETPDNNPMDFNGHGTHVAGLSAAITNNTHGVASVSSGARVMPLRIGWQSNDGNGYGYSTWMADAFIYAADNGADIINLSYGNSGNAIMDAAYYAFASGVLVVTSAGNSDAVTPSGIGGLDFVLTVAALASNDKKAYYSSYGSYVKVSAPGGDFSNGNQHGLLSTMVYPSDFYNGKKYVEFQGTSMASPLVCSVAGLVKAHKPNLDVYQLFDHVVKTADNIDALNPNYVGQLGSGRVNVLRALDENPSSFPNLSVDSLVWKDISGETTNSNGKLDPGETLELQVYVSNKWESGSQITATLSMNDNWPLTLVSGTDNLTSIGSLTDQNNTAVLNFTISAAADAYPVTTHLNLAFSNVDGYDQQEDIPVAISPSVLLVADHEGDEVADQNLEYYYDFFNKYNLSFVEVDDANTLTVQQMLRYSAVFWNVEWTFPSLDETERNLIQDFLAQGGHLFLSGQDIGWDLADVNSSSNQYAASNGASKTFYEQVLHARYDADDSGSRHALGVSDDPVGKNLSFDIYLDKRASNQQFPDQISPLDNAQTVLEYENGAGSAGIRWEGNDAKLVYFSFGGLESITQNEMRGQSAEQLLLWLIGMDVAHTPLTDTESLEPIQVSAIVTSGNAPVSSVKLFWDTDSVAPFNAIDMTTSDGTTYFGEIPARNNDSDVYYFIQAYQQQDIATPFKTVQFFSGADVVPPTLEVLSQPYWNTVNDKNTSGFKFKVKATDNIGIQPNSMYMKYQINDNSPGEKLMNPVDTLGNFELELSYDETLKKGDVVSYYFSVTDASDNSNETVSDTFSYAIDTVEIVDDFENGLDKWDTGEGWGLSTLRNSGSYSVDDSPNGDTPLNSNNALTYNYLFDFSSYQSVWLFYYVRYDIEQDKDTCFVEVSADSGKTWDVVHSYTGQELPRFVEQRLVLDDYAGASAVKLRFRMQSDGDGQKSGMRIDDISLSVSYGVRTGLARTGNVLPRHFALEQNYPNPFNPATTIRYDIASPAQVTLEIYNSVGQRVAVLTNNEEHVPGKYKVQWNGKNDYGHDVASGVYFYRMNIKSNNGEIHQFARKLLLMR